VEAARPVFDKRSPLPEWQQGAGAIHAVAVTPTLSVEAVQERLICEEETADARSPVGVEGAVVSAAGGVVTEIGVAVHAELLPAAS